VVVDTAGQLLAGLVLAAAVSDREGARLLLQVSAARYPLLVLIWGDRHYGGDLIAEVQAIYGITVQVVSKPEGQAGFVPLPRRWVVERVRHEAPSNREEVRDLLQWAVAAAG
jgi:hypothetical protein